MPSRFRPTHILALAIVVLSACTQVNTQESRADEEGFHGVVLSPPFEKPAFVLTDTDGQAFDFRAETDGSVALLFFGYTNCPDVCPVQMANLGAVLSRFPRDVRDAVRVVFVTTDPERDTAERMRAWLDNFDESFIGLRGDSAEVARIQSELRMPMAMRVDRPDGGYDMGHASQIVAFTADGAGRVLYPHGVRQEDWLQDIPRLVAFQATTR